MFFTIGCNKNNKSKHRTKNDSICTCITFLKRRRTKSREGCNIYLAVLGASVLPTQWIPTTHGSQTPVSRPVWKTGPQGCMDQKMYKGVRGGRCCLGTTRPATYSKRHLNTQFPPFIAKRLLTMDRLQLLQTSVDRFRMSVLQVGSTPVYVTAYLHSATHPCHVLKNLLWCGTRYRHVSTLDGYRIWHHWFN